MERDISEETFQYMAEIFSKSLAGSIASLIKENSSWGKKKAVGINEMCHIFGLSEATMVHICAEKASPAFKNGGKTSPWLCFPDEMHKYLLKKAIPYKS